MAVFNKHLVKDVRKEVHPQPTIWRQHGTFCHTTIINPFLFNPYSPNVKSIPELITVAELTALDERGEERSAP